jgi:hypothetical protein
VKGEGYPPHLLAQKMNNRGVQLIENGLHDEAIKTLVKALKFSEQSSSENDDDDDDDDDDGPKKPSSPCCCQCPHCSLASCITSSLLSSSATATSTSSSPPVSPTRRNKNKKTQRRRTLEDTFNEGDEPTSSSSAMMRRRGSRSVSTTTDPQSLYQDFTATTKRRVVRKDKPHAPSSTSTTRTDDDGDNDGDTEHYLYQKPIRVSSYSISNGHSMGVTLSLIVILNLALAHHLKGLTTTTTTTTTHDEDDDDDDEEEEADEVDTALLKKALQLYELAYQLHIDSTSDERYFHSETERIGTLVFTMIVSNNLGEIHRVARNDRKHKLCLQHLLSTVMYMVVDGRQHPQQHQPQQPRSFHPNVSEGGSLSSSSSSLPSPVLCKLPMEEELDGFIRNASAIMRNDICAGAA